MWTLTSLALLATLLFSGPSLARPDGQYNIPNVGTGRRAQYYVLHSDGTYKYGFDSGDGAFEQAMSKNVGSQTGAFGYTDPNGQEIRLEYEAGTGGFVARGDHLPKPSDELARALATVVRRNQPFVDPLANTGDASYSFNFDSDDHSRTEQSNADGLVTGSYNFIDEDGQLREFTYRAGKGIGFEITGEGLTLPTSSLSSTRAQTRRTQAHTQQHYTPPKTPAVTSFRSSVASSAPRAPTTSFRSTHRDANIQTNFGNNGQYSFSYDAGTHSRAESGDENNNVVGKFEFTSPDDPSSKELEYEAGSGTGFIVRADHLPRGPSVPGAEHGQPDGQFARTQNKNFVDPLANSDSDSSYNFGFDSDTYSRTETADEDGNVRGSYTVVEEDGTRVVNEFRAGKGIGFEVKEVSRSSGPRPAPVPRYRASTHAQTGAGASTAGHVRSSVHTTATRTQPQYRGSLANIRSSAGDDGSYSFSYATDTHSRSESGDSDNNVDGEFSFVAIDDGKERSLKYEAGSDTGFIVQADHLPVGPSVPGAEDGKPSGQFARDQSKEFFDPLASSDADSSYNFGFESDTFSRSETADEDGNVRGTYTVVEEDGTRVVNEYRAGKGIGYEVKEISRTAGPRPASFRSTHVASGAHAQGASGARRASTQSYGASGHGRVTGAARQTQFGANNLQHSVNDDGSYSFSYSTDSHSRSESGDSDNNVKGDFSFVAPDDGIRRSLEYEAGRETGFIVNADHLPVGPSVPGAEDGKPSGQFARFQPKVFVDPLAGSARTRASFRGTQRATTTTHSKPSFSYNQAHKTTRKQTQAARQPVRSQISHVSTQRISHSPSFRSTDDSVEVQQSAKSTVLKSSDFQLHQYNAAPGADKFGYVIKYN